MIAPRDELREIRAQRLRAAIFETFMDGVALAFAIAVLAAIWWLA